MTQPTIIPLGQLSAVALEGVIDEFVTREGTDYGHTEDTLEQKRAQVRRQLESGDVVIAFETKSQSWNLIRRVDLALPGSSPSKVPADPKLDALILTYLVADDLSALDQLTKAGLSAEQVRSRALHMGLNGELLRRLRISGRRPTMRACLNCNVTFISAGSGNRLCARCQ